MKRIIASRRLVIFVSVLIITVAIGSYFFLKNRSEQTGGSSTENEKTVGSEEVSEVTGSDLLTYQSVDYGYSFKYPAGFSIVDWLWDRQSGQRIPTNGKTVWVDKNELSEQAIPTESDPSSHYFAVNVIERECNLSEIGGEGVEVEDIVFIGQSAWKATVVDASQMMDAQYRTTIYTNQSPNCYALEAINSDAAGNHDPEIDEMISSFIFL